MLHVAWGEVCGPRGCLILENIKDILKIMQPRSLLTPLSVWGVQYGPTQLYLTLDLRSNVCSHQSGTTTWRGTCRSPATTRGLATPWSSAGTPRWRSSRSGPGTSPLMTSSKISPAEQCQWSTEYTIHHHQSTVHFTRYTALNCTVL